jgi:hypothetical protein
MLSEDVKKQMRHRALCASPSMAKVNIGLTVKRKWLIWHVSRSSKPNLAFRELTRIMALQLYIDGLFC